MRTLTKLVCLNELLYMVLAARPNFLNLRTNFYSMSSLTIVVVVVIYVLSCVAFMLRRLHVAWSQLKFIA